MTARAETWAWLIQRAAALVLAVAVVVHLVTIIYAVRHGLSAEAILLRTRGNGAWLAFYIVFALAVAIHGAHGLRSIVGEMTRWRGASLDVAAAAAAAFLAVAGIRAAAILFG